MEAVDSSQHLSAQRLRILWLSSNPNSFDWPFFTTEVMKLISFSFSFGTCSPPTSLYKATYASKDSIWCWRNCLCLRISFCTSSPEVYPYCFRFIEAPCLRGISVFTGLAFQSFYPQENQLPWRRDLVKPGVCSIGASFWWVVFSGSTLVKHPQIAGRRTFAVLKTSLRLLGPLWPWKTWRHSSWCTGWGHPSQCLCKFHFSIYF